MIVFFGVLGTVAVFTLIVARHLKQHFHRLNVEQELIRLLEKNEYQFTIIDVRDPIDFKTEHVPASLNNPYPLPQRFFPAENLFEKIFVFGPNQRTVQRSAKQLGENGYYNVTYYGAYHHWRGPIIKDTL